MTKFIGAIVTHGRSSNSSLCLITFFKCVLFERRMRNRGTVRSWEEEGVGSAAVWVLTRKKRPVNEHTVIQVMKRLNEHVKRIIGLPICLEEFSAASFYLSHCRAADWRRHIRAHSAQNHCRHHRSSDALHTHNYYGHKFAVALIKTGFHIPHTHSIHTIWQMTEIYCVFEARHHYHHQQHPMLLYSYLCICNYNNGFGCRWSCGSHAATANGEWCERSGQAVLLGEQRDSRRGNLAICSHRFRFVGQQTIVRC